MNKILLLVLLPFMVMAQNIWYVDRDASGANTGRNWTDAWNGFDSTGGIATGINWNVLQAGDTIYVSGGTDSTNYYGYTTDGIDISGGSGAGTPHTFASGNPVIIIPAKYQGRTTGGWVNHIGDVYFTTSRNDQNKLMQILNKSNVKFYGFTFYDRRTDNTLGNAYIQIGNADQGDRDSLITLENCHIISKGLSDPLFLDGSKTTIKNCIIEILENHYPNSQDLVGVSSGRGGHTFDNNLFIARGKYQGLTQSANAGVSCTDNSLTDTRLSMVTNYHTGLGIYIQVGRWSATILSNNSNTFTINEWDFVPVTKEAESTVHANSTSVTWDDGSYTVNEFVGYIVTCSGHTMTITSNTATTLTGTGWSGGWTGGTNVGYTITTTDTRPANGLAYTVNTDAHRDGIQISNIGFGRSLGGVYATERLTFTISNNRFINLSGGSVQWTGMLYSSGPYCNQTFLIYNNIIVNELTQSAISNIIMGNPFEFDQSLHILNNTVITKGLSNGTLVTGWNNDTLEIKNNLFIADTFITRQYNLDDAGNFAGSHKEIDYNIYAELNGISASNFGFDNGNNNSYTNWLAFESNTRDANSDTLNSSNVTWSDKYDTTASGYYTTTGRDLGTDLSATYPFLATDILGNPRSGTWDIGAIEYIGGTPPASIGGIVRGSNGLLWRDANGILIKVTQ